MDAPAEQTPLRTKRKYTPRVICTDPELKYRYKKRPGRRPNESGRKRYEPERTDAEKRRHSRLSAAHKAACAKLTDEQRKQRAAHIIEIAKTQSYRVSRLGIPDGMNREQAEAAWAVAKTQADRLFTKMIEQGKIDGVGIGDFDAVPVRTESGTEFTVLVPKTDEAKASVALREAMVMALGPINAQTKLSAINTVLKFTKSPPATKFEVSKAEDLLAAALADINKEDGDK